MNITLSEPAIRKSKYVYESAEEEARCKAIIESVKQAERDRKKKNWRGNIHTRKKAKNNAE